MNYTKDYNGPLPERLYPNWMTLYRHLRANVAIEQKKEILFEENWTNGRFVHVYTPDYLMARCFEEMAASTFTIDDLMNIECALANYQGGYNPEIVNRIRELITLQHMATYPDRS